MAEVVVVAFAKAKAGSEDDVLAILTPLVEATQAEPGNVKYTLNRGLQDPSTFVIVERWASQEDLDSHFKQPHMAALGELGQHLDGGVTIIPAEPLGVGDPGKATL